MGERAVQRLVGYTPQASGGRSGRAVHLPLPFLKISKYAMLHGRSLVHLH
jgi:hypothetical protein